MGNKQSNYNSVKRVSNFGNVVPITKECINEPINLEFRDDITTKLVPIPFDSIPLNSTLNISLDYTPLTNPTNATILEIKSGIQSSLKLSIKDGNRFYIKVGTATETPISQFTMGTTVGKASVETKNQGQNITLTPPVPFVKFNFEIRLFQSTEYTRPKFMVVVTAISRELGKNYFIDVTTREINGVFEIKNYNNEIEFGPDIKNANIDNVCVQAETKDNGNPVNITDFRIIDEIGKITSPLINSSIIIN
jgi:hypothetical protein